MGWLTGFSMKKDGCQEIDIFLFSLETFKNNTVCKAVNFFERLCLSASSRNRTGAIVLKYIWRGTLPHAATGTTFVCMLFVVFFADFRMCLVISIKYLSWSHVFRLTCHTFRYFDTEQCYVLSAIPWSASDNPEFTAVCLLSKKWGRVPISLADVSYHNVNSFF